MKIVCPSCETSYQIDDRKVTGTGRVFRINCRACNEAILVDGLDGQGAGLSGWYLNVDGERHGPMELAELRARLSEGAVDPATLIWSNGMDRWRPASEIDEIVAPWEAETVQSDAEEEEEGETTLISMDEIARVHAEIEARDAPLLSDDEVEIIEEMAPPELPVFDPPDAIAETVQRASYEDDQQVDSAVAELPPFEPTDAVAETVQRASSDESSEGDVAQTLVFKLDPSTLGSKPALPEASEVISSAETGEDLHEVGGSAAALFRLDDLDLGNESKTATPAGQGGVGLTSNSLFVGDRTKSTDPAAVRARPRPAGTVTTNVPIVKKKGALLWAWGIGILGIAVGIALGITVADSNEEPIAAAPDSAKVAPVSAEAASEQPAPEDKVAAPAQKPVEPVEPAKPVEPVKPPPEAEAPAAAPAAVAADTPVAAEKPSAVPKAKAKGKTTQKAVQAPVKAAESAATRARKRAARRALRDEPLPNFGRAPKKTKTARKERAKSEPKVVKSSSSVNDLLGQLKNNSKGAQGEELEKAPQKLSASEVRGTLRKRQSRFKSCYRQMVNRPEGAVTVKTSFKIVSSGRVSSARIVSAGGVDASVKSCILEAVKGAKFPRFRDPEMIVNYPILLR